MEVAHHRRRKDIVVTVLKGGLGNQLFQYSFGKSLALRFDAALFGDLSWFLHSGHGAERPYLLDSYKIDLQEADEETLSGFSLGRTLMRLRPPWPGVIRRAVPPGLLSYYAEARFHYDPRTKRLRPPICVDGYWQSFRYFNHIRPELLQRIAPVNRFSAELARIAEQARSNPHAIAIQIRRGDYVTDPAVNSYHGLCDLEYFRRGVTYLQKTARADAAYVFTDDPFGVTSYLSQLPIDCKVVTSFPNSPAHHLFLLSQFRNFVISNSSFGWWGAWLSERTGKVVVCPARWFSSGPSRTNDLVPADWIRM